MHRYWIRNWLIPCVRLVTFIPGQTLEHHGENWETQSDAVRLGEFRVVMDGKWCSTSEHFLVLASYELNESRLIEAGILREVVQADCEGAVGSTGYSSRVSAAFPREEPVSAFVFDRGLGSTHWGYFVVGWINDPDILEFEIEITDGRRLRLNADEHQFFTAVLTIGPVEKTRGAALQLGIRAVSVTAQC